jgi:hypothetical protein
MFGDQTLVRSFSHSQQIPESQAPVCHYLPLRRPSLSALPGRSSTDSRLPRSQSLIKALGGVGKLSLSPADASEACAQIRGMLYMREKNEAFDYGAPETYPPDKTTPPTMYDAHRVTAHVATEVVKKSVPKSPDGARRSHRTELRRILQEDVTNYPLYFHLVLVRMALYERICRDHHAVFDKANPRDSPLFGLMKKAEFQLELTAATAAKDNPELTTRLQYGIDCMPRFIRTRNTGAIGFGLKRTEVGATENEVMCPVS